MMRPRGKADTWLPPAGARASTWPWRVPAVNRSVREYLERWLAVDFAAGRLMPWLPVAFGAGIILYFTADTEPSRIAVSLLVLACLTATVAARRRPLAFPLLLAVAAATLGFAVVTWRTSVIAHPVLHYPAFGVTITGFVEVREERERTDRVVVAVSKIDGRRLDQAPDRVRVSVRKGTAPAVGAFVEFKARLNPPLAPLRPGGYDFARDLYFQRIGATGIVTGQIKVLPPPARPGLKLQFATFVDGVRTSIDQRIRAVIRGDTGAIASALITGKRDAISAPVNDAMYVSSLAHVLSISGYHMAVVAGVMFFVIRALLALVPDLAMRCPIKKWAAATALAAAGFYLVLSGAEVATQRAFYMTAIVLVGVMVDRPALTLRTLAVAALVVLMIAPEAVVHPSFQMSFAATVALVAAWERGMPWASAGVDSPVGARVALWGGREILALVLASLVAGLATMPYAAFHFHRAAPYGVIANLFAMPVVSIIVMPAGLIGVALIPFGFDAPFWRVMGKGIEWMIDVAVWVASLPGAVGHVAAFGAGPLLVCTAGILVACLLKSPLRWSGAAFIGFAAVWAIQTPRPDVLVSATADVVAVRTAGGRYAILHRRGDVFAIREWLAADADPRNPADPTLRDGTACDAIGCIARLRDGSAVSVVLEAEAFAEDCRKAALIVTRRTAPPECQAQVIDRTVWRQSGALSLLRRGEAFEIVAARPPGYDRPWSRPPRVAMPTPATPIRPAPRDATPRTEDLDAEDVGATMAEP